MTDRNERRDPQEMLERLEQMKEEAEATIRKYEEMSADLGADAVEVVSEDGLVRVKLDADGNVDHIGIDEQAMRQRQSLGPSIMDLIQEAKATYGLKMADLAQALVGDKMDVMAMVTRDMPEHMQERARERLDQQRRGGGA